MFERRWYQTEVLESLIKYFSLNKTGNPLIAAPTGVGKSYMIAQFMEWALKFYPSTRILMMTHVKELIEQDFEKLKNIWPASPAGIYSAALKRRDKSNPIVFGGVKSVLNEIQRSYTDQLNVPHQLRHFGWRDLLIIDEAHLLSPVDQTTYRKVINELKIINPNLRVVGFTATPYRLGQGSLLDGKNALFSDTAYNLTSKDNINRLVKENYMCELISKPTSVNVDTSNISISGWDFNANELGNEIQKVMFEALRETCYHAYESNRKSWMIFCSNVENCESAFQILRNFGVSCQTTHSKKKKNQNDDIIRAFKNSEFTALISANKMTTGFDHPPTDLISMLRATISPGLWAQILGRGARPFEGKENCLVLDYGGNIARLGPFNDIRIPKAKDPDKVGDAPVKICPQTSCQQLNHAAARECSYCGYAFPIRVNISSEASTDKVMINDYPEIKRLEVQRVFYGKYQKEGKKPCLKVLYACGLKNIIHWLFFEDEQQNGKKARDWWRLHSAAEPPRTVDEAVKRKNELKTPVAVDVHINKKYPSITDFYFN